MGIQGVVNTQMKVYYHPKLKALSRNLRKKSTLSEVLLWNILKGKKIKGYQFMRQKPIDNYIVDFFCSKLKLIIEIDGISHNGKYERNQIRQLYERNIKKDIRNGDWGN